ncbi:MAG: acyl carrier protein [Verrucomicrobia bacterium]|nr:acyl carrier protein [Verrucomicrobiota bacterium]
MSADDRLRELANRVRKHKGVGEFDRFVPGTRLREDLGFDSLDLAEFTVRIEQRCGVDVFAAGVVHTWGEVVARVEQHDRSTARGA